MVGERTHGVLIYWYLSVEGRQNYSPFSPSLLHLPSRIYDETLKFPIGRK